MDCCTGTHENYFQANLYRMFKMRDDNIALGSKRIFVELETNVQNSRKQEFRTSGSEEGPAWVTGQVYSTHCATGRLGA